MRTIALLACAIAIACLLAGCALVQTAGSTGARPEGSSNGSDTPTADQARTVADSAVNDWIGGDLPALYALMEQAYRDEAPQAALPQTLSAIEAFGGKVLSAQYKGDEVGSKANVLGTPRPIRKVWYSTKTTKSSGGPYYIFVDVVLDNGRPAVTTFSLVNFPVNGPPDWLE